ncbi:putative ribonuclease H-like domain-containing protein [Tanacetum coccineum]
MALIVFSDSEEYNDKTCTKTCLKNYETLKKHCDDLIVKLNQTEFTAATYKTGLVTVEEQLITYRKNEVLFSEEVAVLKREVACKDYEINVLKSEFEKVKQEKEDIEFKIEKFDNASKSLDKMLGNPEFKSYGSKDKQVLEDTSSFVESSLNVDKETVFLVDKKIEFVKPKNHEKPIKKSIRTHPNAQRNIVPRAVLMKTSLKPINTARTVNTAHPKSIAKAVNTARPKAVNTARPHSAVVNAVRVNHANAIKASAWKATNRRYWNLLDMDLKNIVPKESLTCFVAKATSDESMLWHRRLSHINFKNKNKLVKDNLVRGLPTKRFENNQTCVACLKGKQHIASCTQGELNAVGNGEPKFAADDQKHVEDGPHNESDEKDKCIAKALSDSS